MTGPRSAAAWRSETIAAQYEDWLARLSATYEESGQKSKRAARWADGYVGSGMQYNVQTSVHLCLHMGNVLLYLNMCSKPTYFEG